MTRTPKKIKKNTGKTISENADIRKKKSETLAYAKKYLNLNELFPVDGTPRIKDLTEYKIKKIRKAIRVITGRAGGKHYLERDFVKVRRTSRLKKYNNKIGMPSYFGGVILNGGEKFNSNVRITKNLELKFIRGEYDYTSAALDAMTERSLIDSINHHEERIESSDATYLGTNGNFIFPSYKEGHTPTEAIIKKALFLKTKYDAMASAGEHRFYKDRFNKDGTLMSRGVASKMSEWGISLLWKEQIKK